VEEEEANAHRAIKARKKAIKQAKLRRLEMSDDNDNDEENGEQYEDEDELTTPVCPTSSQISFNG
jgi:hypothetical protein